MKIFKVTQHPPKTLVWWYKNRPSIHMDPPYQRKGRLWSVTDKAFLIDSIMNGFDVPKLYMADFQISSSNLNTARLPYAIIDGKQRLEAIFDFFDNRLTLNPSFIWRRDPSLKLGGLSLKDLRSTYPTVVDLFENESIDVMSVVAEDEADIHELFVRLNRSKPLTGAEIRNAITGHTSEAIRQLGSHEFFQANIKFKTQRAEDLNTAAKVLLFEFNNELTSTKKKDLDQFADDESVDVAKLKAASLQTASVLDDMTEVFLPADDLLRSSGTVPVYYWLVRSVPFNRQHLIREFLVNFEVEREKARQSRKAGLPISKGLEPFARFDDLNRSTNDIGSYLGRYEVLESAFSRWGR